MKCKTKKILMIVALAVVLLASVTAVYAYLSDFGKMENKFTVGNNSVEVEENFVPPPELKKGNNPFVKEVQVANTGNVPCYVRVFFDFSDSLIKDSAFISKDVYKKYADGSDNFDSMEWFTFEEYLENLPDGWVYISESEDSLLGGYFYYIYQLPVGESTECLFKAVNAYFETENDLMDFEIVIVADSVQVTDKDGKGFTGTDGKGTDAYKEAWSEFLNRRTTP